MVVLVRPSGSETPITAFLRVVAQLNVCLDSWFKSLGSTLVFGFGQIIVKHHVAAENHQINNSIQ